MVAIYYLWLLTALIALAEDLDFVPAPTCPFWPLRYAYSAQTQTKTHKNKPLELNNSATECSSWVGLVRANTVHCS